MHDTLQQIDLVYRMVARFPEHLQLATSSDDVWKQYSTSDRISSLMGAEGLHQIGNSASVIRMYHRLGVRYMTLTHECHNRYADSCTPQLPLHNGLSKAGTAMLHEMNRVGMIIDLSHTSVETMHAALNITFAPVIFSHSSSFAICPHPRNVPNEVLFGLKQNGGVIMITFVPEFTNCQDPDGASLTDVVRHIEYVGSLIGYDHVGIGADFDGMPSGPKGLEDVSKYGDLLHALRRDISRQDLQNIIGGNVLRVLRQAEIVSEQMASFEPLEDQVKPLF